MLKSDKKCPGCGKIVDKRYYEKHLNGPAHERLMAQKRKRKPKQEQKIVPVEEPKSIKMENFRELLS